jgi:methionyl-tRNA formyltransferase
MRLIFAGTPEFARQALAAIIAAGHEVALVLTQPDRPSGRGMKLVPSAVKEEAARHGIAVYQPERLRDPATHGPLREAGAEVMVVAAYGLILPPAVLAIPPRGCLNIHASLLPRWRGAAPIQRAIEAGDAETGIAIMQMEAGLDTGPVLLDMRLPILDTDTGASLHDKLAALGAAAVVEALAKLDVLVPVPQPDTGVTYASKLTKEEARLDWTLPARVLARKVRAFNPVPGSWTVLNGEPLKIWQATVVPGKGAPGEVLAADAGGVVIACGEAALRLTELQRAGSRRMTAEAFLAGAKIAVGSRLGA